MSVSNKISTLVKNQFPDFYKEDGENFLAFIEAYYEYMEQSGKLTDGIQNLQDYRDIDRTLDEYIEYFRKDLLPSIPASTVADKRLLAKAIKFFNQSRGTLASYKLLFRSIYNEDVELSYPADQILKVSDGDYRIDRYLISSYDDKTYKFIGKTIKGTSSGAEALVEDVVRRIINGRDIMQILVSNIKGTFNNLEPIKLLSSIAGGGHAPIVEAGISTATIASPGGEYAAGDIIKLISSDVGDFGKVVVTDTKDLGGTLTFSLIDGGSGYTPSTQPGGSVITVLGGDGSSPASFQVSGSDIGDTFAVTLNTNFVVSNNIFGSLAPIVAGYGLTSTFANTPLSSPDFGFPEIGEEVTQTNYRDNRNAIFNIANTQTIKVGDSLYSANNSANATVLSVVSTAAGNTAVRVDGYKNFTTGHTIRSRYANSSGNTVGTSISFQSNTVGYHVLQMGNNAGTTVSEGDELVGAVSGTFGVVKNVVAIANGYTAGVGGADDRTLLHLVVTANTTANLSSQFDNGPLKPFVQNEGLRVVGSVTNIGNTANDTANTSIENIHTKLSDSFLFSAETIGSIDKISLVIGGAGYSMAPYVKVKENDIASLGIGEAYITVQSNNINWGTGNSSFTKLDTNDKIVQSTTGATGHIKSGHAPNQNIKVTSHANGIYEMTVRVWQDMLQRTPGGISFANNSTVSLKSYNSSFTPGLEADTRPVIDTGTAKIVLVKDEGVLGDNSIINAGVGANGTITGLKVLDSGYAYKDAERVTMAATTRPLATSAEVILGLGGVANSEGYYATTRSHISSSRGYIQDSKYYQEYSYEIISAISLDRYKDYALKLVHPAGQALFGKFRLQSNAFVNITATTQNKKRSQSNGTISINNGSYTITGVGTSFLSEFANNDTIVVEYLPKSFYSIPLNIVSSNTSANVKIAWANTNLSSANTYYITGNI
jgi:hypothetical protein